MDQREHMWVQKVVGAFAAGLLSESDTNRFERHLGSCDDCREALESIRDESRSGHHLPNSLISHWPSRAMSLRGLQRELVRRHLESCGECTEILRHLGHEPRLERIPELEATSEVLKLLRPQSQMAPPRPVPVWMRRDFWMGSAATAAVAASFALALGPAIWNIGNNGGSMARLAPGGDGVAQLALTTGLPNATVRGRDSSGRIRGSTGADTTIHFLPGQSSIRIRIAPEPDLRLTEMVQVELRNQKNEVLSRWHVQYAYIMEEGRGLAISAAGSLTESDLVLWLRWTDDKGTVHATAYPIHLRLNQATP